VEQLQRDGMRNVCREMSASIIFIWLMSLLAVMYKLIENSGKEPSWKTGKEFLVLV
jgi:hypothetical protein